MQDQLSLGLSINKTLMEIILSKEYQDTFQNRYSQTLSANSSFSNYRQEKAKLNPIVKQQNIIRLINNILAIANAFLAIVLIKKNFFKQD